MWYFHAFRFVFVCIVFWVEFQHYRGVEEEVSLGVIMTNTEIKFHILLFTLSSSSKISDPLSFCHSIKWVLHIFHLLGVLWPECSMIGSGLWRTLLLRLPVADPLVSGWTECSMLWSGLLILIYVTCRMKCESLQSIGCFFLYPAFWLVLFPGFWMANRPEMATSDWSDFLAFDWLTMEHTQSFYHPIIS